MNTGKKIEIAVGAGLGLVALVHIAFAAFGVGYNAARPDEIVLRQFKDDKPAEVVVCKTNKEGTSHYTLDLSYKEERRRDMGEYVEVVYSLQ